MIVIDNGDGKEFKFMNKLLFELMKFVQLSSN